MLKLFAALPIAATILATAACGPARSEPKLDGREFRAASGGSAALERACEDLGADAAAPAVCLSGPGAKRVGKGRPLSVDIGWSGVPPGSALVVSLVRDGPRPERGYFGPEGALMLTPQPVSGSGRMRFRWDGNSFACAPTDFPMWCREPTEIGRYRLRVSLYDQALFPIVGWPSPHPPKLIAQADGPAFVVTGTPDYAPLGRALLSAAADRLSRASTPGSLLPDPAGLKVYQSRNGAFCIYPPASPPYRSSVKACIAKNALVGDAGLVYPKSELVDVTGTISLPPGTLGREEASKIALALAERDYVRRVAFRHQPQVDETGYRPERDGDYYAWIRLHPAADTYLSDGVQEAVFRPDLGGAWAIVAYEIMAGGVLPDSERFADKLLILVRPDRKACLIEKAGYKAPLRHDPRTAALDCGTALR